MKVEIVGSFLPSDSLDNAHNDFKKGVIDAETLKSIENMAITELVERQIQLGLKQVTSGELRREYWDKDFWFDLQGISKARFDSGRIYRSVEIGSDLMRVSGRIGFNPSHKFLDDMRYLKKAVGTRAVCMQCLPSPANLYLELILMSDGDLSKIYPSPTEIITDISDAYNKTIQELYRLGCRSVQLDDTACGRLCQDNFTKRLLQGGIDLIALHTHFITLLNDSLSGLPEDMETSLYLSGGDMIVPEWEHIEYPDNIMPKVLCEVKVDKFFIPFDIENDYQVEVLRHLPKGRKVVLGLMDAHTPFIERPDSIRHTVELASRYVPQNNISLSTRTGFKLTNHEDRGLTYEDQWYKLSWLQSTYN